MLILTRKSGESIRIGKDVVIHILESNSKQMKLGISAPREVPVYRNEVYEKIQSENRAAATSQQASLKAGLESLRAMKGKRSDRKDPDHG